MKNTARTVVVILFLAVASFSAPLPKTARTFNGEIMDSQCAMMGSHAKMEAMHHIGDNPKMCTLECVKMGGKFVLYNKARKKTYQLDNQEAPKAFAGEKVKVIGTYDSATGTIHVEKIEPRS